MQTMQIHNSYISDEIRSENKTYNDNFLRKIGLINFKNVKGSVDSTDWELRGFNVFETVWLKNIDRSMSFLKDIGINTEDYDLLDIGSGNGIACIYFYLNYKFRKVTGVEICEDLNKQSLLFSEIFSKNMNIDISNLNHVSSNILDYKLEDKKYILFFFNSVKFEILEKFINKNIDFLNKNKCIFLLINDHCINEITSYCKLIKRDSFYNISVLSFDYKLKNDSFVRN